MAEFDKEIIRIEGGYVNDPDDAGKETKYGISKRSYPNVDIANLTVQGAEAIYLRDFWNPCKLSEVRDQITANIIFRFAVNAGVITCAKLLQRALNSFAPIVLELKEDGIIGTQTLHAIAILTPLRLQNALRVAICKYYLDLVLKKPSQEKFFKGWINRALM